MEADLLAFFAEGRDLVLIQWLWPLLIVVALLVPLQASPYGKLKENEFWGRLRSCRVNVRVGWFLQELPSFAIPLFLVLNYGGKYVGGQANPNIVLVSMFILHYAQR